MRPKPFAEEQCVLSTHHKTAVQIADTACLQVGGLFWYPSEGTLPLLLGLYCCTLVTFVIFGI